MIIKNSSSIIKTSEVSKTSEVFMNQDAEYINAEDVSHAKTRQLLSSSKSNWANDIIADREDRKYKDLTGE